MQSKEKVMTPEQTLDWLAEQHKSQCNEDRPVQEWIRSMKSMLPAPVQEPALVIYQGEIAKSNLPKGFTGMLYTTPPAAPVQQASCLVRRLDGVADLRRLEGDHDEAGVIDEAVAVLKAISPAAPPAPVQEPVAVDCCANCLRPEHEHQDGKCPKPFTTVWHAWDYDFPPDAPPAAQRQWVGLTQNEMDDITCGMVKSWVIEQLARSIEAKLKEKNNG
jgi:hypothetical protein